MSCADAGTAPTLRMPAGDEAPVEIDLFDYCARRWHPNEHYDEDEIIRPSVANGYALKAKNAGDSGANEPLWGSTLGKIVRDGSVNWELIEAGTNGIDEATSPQVNVSPSGLSVEGLGISESRKLIAVYKGGSAGTTYTVTFTFQVNGLTRTLRHKVSVT
jgi:hypothetical protein